jgi:8-oxo-dGTP diphosphatase
MQRTYEYPKADITTDAVIFGINRNLQKLQVLLIERGRPGTAFYGCWALPGGFLEVNTTETLHQGCLRELVEETHLDSVPYLEQLATFGRPDRDPRGRVVTVAYWGCVDPQQVEVKADDDAKNIGWFDIDNLPELAFDHAEVVSTALNRLRGKLRWQPVGCWLLPPKFTLRELQGVYEIILNRALDSRVFRKKIMPHVAKGILMDTGEKRSPLVGRPATLYYFNADKYEDLRNKGLEFEV